MIFGRVKKIGILSAHNLLFVRKLSTRHSRQGSNNQIGGELIAAVPISTEMNQTTTEEKKEVAPIVFRPPPATEELVKGKEKESGEPAPEASRDDSNNIGSSTGEAQARKKQKKVNNGVNNASEVKRGRGRPAKAKPSFVPPQFNPGLGLGYAPGLPGQMPLLVPSFNHHMYGSYYPPPGMSIHRSGGVGGAYPMYHPQTSVPGVAHRTPMYSQAILQTVSTDSQADANNKQEALEEMKDEDEVKLLKSKDDIKDELAEMKKDIAEMKNMVAQLINQNKELIVKQNED